MSATATTPTQPKTGYVLSITRTFDAPRELVWKAWTDPEMAMHWMGPRGFEATEFEPGSDVGSTWRMTMEGNVPGTDKKALLKQGGVIKEMKPPELLVMTFAWENRACVGLPDSAYNENVITIRLEEKGEKTVMHFTQTPFATESERDGHNGGWNSAFDKFAEFMLAEQPDRTPAADDVPTELHLRRRFAAPRAVVFEAWTNPEILQQWWGPKGFTNPVCEVNARQGGAIRIHMQAPDGTVYPMTGKFIEVYPPYRFHFTSAALDEKGEPLFEIWNSVFFAEVAGGTEVILDAHVTKMTPEAPRYVKGMNEGWSQSLEKLGELLTRSRS
jgi:uncharacterized protein YndB with AHSA1/START domain